MQITTWRDDQKTVMVDLSTRNGTSRQSLSRLGDAINDALASGVPTEGILTMVQAASDGRVAEKPKIPSLAPDQEPIYAEGEVQQGLIDLPAAAQRYNCSISTLQTWVKRGRLKTHGRLRARTRGGKSSHEGHQRGLNSKLHLVVDAHGMPVGLALTEGTVADCTQAGSLLADITAKCLLADRGYDTNAIIAEALAQGMEPVIPPRSHCREPRYYDQYLYQLRHLVENAFLDFKLWRAVATRYAKSAASFLAICQIRALVLWTKLF